MGEVGAIPCEQTANIDFANRSTASGARTIMTRKWWPVVGWRVTSRGYFLSRSTARGARTIMTRK